jgi:Zn-dependent protease with chaperone function
MGCAARPRHSAEATRLSPEDCQTRLSSVAKRFEPHVVIGSCRYQVSDSPNPGAFAWPDGRILVTRGLIDLLNDDELAAAVAHEIGHLLADGHVAGRFSLHGATGAPNVEARADTLGCQLLAEAGIAPASMAGMLEKLARAPGLTHGQRAAVRKRIQRATNAPPPASPAQK